jgi:hypothetical protein
MGAVARSIHEARREVAQRLTAQVDAATHDPHGPEMSVLVAIADGTALRGIPAISRNAAGSALGGVPGSDAHLDLMDRRG